MNKTKKAKQRREILEKIIVCTKYDNHPDFDDNVKELVNMISCDIGDAISPLNEPIMPFVIYCLENYVAKLRNSYPEAAKTTKAFHEDLDSEMLEIVIPSNRRTEN